MGVVYSPEQLRRLPRPGDHITAAEDIRAILDSHLPDSDGVGYVIHGSVPEGRSSIRSDLDVLIVAGGWAIERSGQTIGKMIGEVMGDCGVPIELKVADSQMISDGSYQMDTLFATHIVGSLKPEWSRGITPELFVRYLGASQEDIYRQCVEYGRAKMGKFGSAILAGGCPDLRVYQRALELPTAILRKSLTTLARLDFERLDLDIDRLSNAARTREELESLSRLQRAKINPRLLALWAYNVDAGRRDLTVLMDWDNKYTVLLDQFVEGEIGVEEYTRWIYDQARYTSILSRAHKTAGHFVRRHERAIG